MKRRFFSVLLAVLMVVNCLGAFNFSFAAGDVYEYIVGVDVGAIDPAFTLAFNEGDYVRADALSNAALDIFEAELKSALPAVQVVDRITLLTPGVVVRASSDEINKIELMKYVSKVYENIKYDAPATLQPVRTRSRRSIQPMSTGALDTVYKFVDSRYTGKGSVVAVVDAMMNPKHPAFADVSKIDEVVTESDANAVQNGSYISKKIPFAWNYATNDHKNLNPINTTNGHGQHVAGIAAGNKTLLMGMDWQGVAPDAQLLLMNIASTNRDFSSDGILNALGDALKLRSNVVNMSLGSPKGGYTNKASIDMERVIEPLVNAGIVVAVAAGNSGDVSKLNLSTDNPDLNSLANPANSDNVLTVASNLNNTEYVNKIECTTEKKEGSEGGQLISTSKLEFEYEICNDEFAQSGDYKPASSLDDLDKLNTSDNVLWIGELGAYKKLTADNKAKVDVLLFDSWQSSEGINIPIISSPNVKTLQDNKADIKKLELKFLGKIKQDPNRMSDFTSWGIAPEGSLKPDISAPGDRVLSLNNNKGLYLSQGTSMATPVVSGAVAIFNEYFKSSPFKALKGKDKADIIKTVLMNSATPIRSGEMIASPRQQGAGMLNVDNATKIDFTVVDAQSNIASKFVGDVEDNINLNLKIKNWSGSAKNLTARAEILVQNNTNKKMELSSKVSKTVALDGINLDANGEITKDFNINISDVDVSAYQNGAFVDGFLYLNDGTKEISFPFASFKKVNGKKLSNLAAIEKSIYDFKFADESPMYWEFAQKAGDTRWHYLSTHIQSGNKIAGVKNFDEINEKVKQRAQDLRSSNTKDNPFVATNPEFQLHDKSLIFSKNNPVANTSEFTPYIVALRAGKFKTYIKNGDSEIAPAEFYIEFNNIETEPFKGSNAIHDINDTNKIVGYLYYGYNVMNSVNISTLADGKYSYVIETKPFKDALKKEYYDLQSFEIPFIIDNTAPEVLDKKINANTISFKVKDANGIGEVKIGDTVVEPKSKTDNTEAIYEYTVANEKLQTLNADADNMQALEISAKDIAENTTTIKLSDVPEKQKPVVTFVYPEGVEIEDKYKKMTVDDDGKLKYSDVSALVRKLTKKGYNTIYAYNQEFTDLINEISLDNIVFNEDKTIYVKHEKREYGVTLIYKPYDNFNKIIATNYDVLTGVKLGDNITEGVKQAIDKKLKNGFQGKYFVEHYEKDGFERFNIENGILIDETMIASSNNIPIYVYLGVYKYKVKFANTDLLDVEVYHGREVKTPTNPTREGSKFVGWYKDPEFTDKFYFGTKITKDTTIYAKWDVNKYNVVFMDGDTEYKKEIVEHGKELKAPTAPTKEGYDFVEWQIDGAKAEFPITVKSNITLKAVWKIKTYKVTFDGVNEAAQTVEHGKQATQPQAPTKDGSTFAGWYADAEYRAEFNFATPITKNTTIYAKWDVNKYNVVFMDDTVEYKKEIVEHGKELQAPTAPTKDGYNFVEWQIDGTKATFPITVKKNLTLKAVWKIKSFTVKFEGTDISDAKVEYSQKVTQPTAPTKDGSTFAGWYADAEYRAAFDFATPITKNTTIYAKWDVNKYNVVFMDGDVEYKKEIAEHGTELKAPNAPTKDGYDFVGWKNGESDVTFPIKVTSNITLKAVWKIKTYTVKFEGTDISDATVDYNQKVTQPQAPTKDGSTFAGWFADAEYRAEFDFTKPITDNTTIYAKWDVNKYNVVFMDGDAEYKKEIAEHGTELQAPTAPTKDGYNFVEWQIDGTKATFPITVTKKLTLNAVWKIKTYKVTFDGVQEAAQTVEHGKQATQPQAPTKDGSTFAGWYSDREYTTEFDFATPITKNTTIYAKWDVKEYTVVIVDGEDILREENVKHGEKLKEPTAPIKDGYDFVGWYADAELTTKFDFNAPITEEKTIYAKWKTKSFTVKFEGTDISDVTVDYNQNVTKPQAPTKEGSTFAGWYADRDFTTAFDFTKPITKNTTIYAKWDVNKYNVVFVDGEDILREENVKHGEKLKEPTALTKEGYDFVGWYADVELTKEFDFNAPIKEGKIIYAKWKIKTLTVKFEGTDIPDATVDYNQKVTQPQAPTKEGSTFAGWFTDAGYTTEFDFTKPITKNTTIYAKWIKKLFVSYEFVSSDNSKTLPKAVNDLKPVAVEKLVGDKVTPAQLSATEIIDGDDKWTFEGYDKNELTVVDGENKFVGTWKWHDNRPSFSIKIDADNGSEVSSVSIKKGESFEEPEAPTKDGYDFVEWQIDGAKAEFPITVTKNITLKAVWEIKRVKVKVTFDFKQPTLENKVVEIEKGTVLKESEFERKIKIGYDEYEFDAWYEDEAFTTKADLTKGFDKDTTLYAKWNKVQKPAPQITMHKVTFVDGSVTKVVEVEDGKKVTEPTKPQKAEHEFLGWFDGSDKFDFDTEIKSDITLVAKWKKIVKPQPQPNPEPSPNPEPYVPQPYEPYKPSLPGGRYEPAPKYEPKQQPKAEPKKEDKKVEEKVQPVHESKPITVMAPTLPVALTDIPATEVGDAIKNMVARGVLKGTGADKFEPETTITRSMVTEVFMRIATEKTIDTAQEFTDVKQEDWYNNSVKWAASKNIIKGFEDGTFKPNQKVTAQEFAVMLKRMLDIYKIEMPNQKAIDEGKYQALQEWSKESVIKVLEKGLIEETDAPIETREITRAELAKALDMIIKFIEQQ